MYNSWMADTPSRPSPEPFDPTSKEEVEARFGTTHAERWVKASTALRAAMIKQLLRQEAQTKSHDAAMAEEMFGGDEDEGEELTDEQLDARRAKSFVLHGGETGKKLLEKKRDQYLGEITMKLGLAKNPQAKHAALLGEDVATRTLQVHAIDLLLAGTLSFAALKPLVEADPACAALSDVGVEYEYDALLDRLLEKGIAKEIPAS